MRTKNDPGPALDPAAEQATLEYLRANPDIFVRHPEVVENLSIPHGCGKAVSLVQYQVGVLRDKNHELRRRMKELVANARDNEDLARRLHRMTLGLVECAAVDEVFARVYQAMRDEFQAEFTAIRLFAAPRSAADQGLAEFVGDDPSQRELFATVLEAGRPVCGRLRREQLKRLLGERAAEVGSGALIALGHGRAYGVLAVCSREPQRYHPGMGTVFLRQLGEIVSHVLVPYIEKRPPEP